MAADIHAFAPDFILRDVRTNAAVAGIPPANHEAMFAKDNQSISFCSWNFVLVILSAILADMMVSNIAIIAIVRAAIPISVYKGIWDLNPVNNPDQDTDWISWNLRSGKLSDNVRTASGMSPCFIKYHTTMASILTGMMPGTLGRYFFIIWSNTKAITNIPNAAQFVCDTCAIVSRKLANRLSCAGNHVSHKAPLNWLTEMIIATHTINPWSAVDGIKVMYLVRRSARISNIIRPVAIATKGINW